MSQSSVVSNTADSSGEKNTKDGPLGVAQQRPLATLLGSFRFSLAGVGSRDDRRKRIRGIWTTLWSPFFSPKGTDGGQSGMWGQGKLLLLLLLFLFVLF